MCPATMCGVLQSFQSVAVLLSPRQHLIGRMQALIYTGLGNAVIGDILIALSLSFILKLHLKDIPRCVK